MIQRFKDDLFKVNIISPQPDDNIWINGVSSLQKQITRYRKSLLFHKIHISMYVDEQHHLRLNCISLWQYVQCIEFKDNLL